MIALLVALAVAVAGAWAPPDEAVVAARVRDAKKLPDLAARLAYVSEPFVGAPYRLSPLGEGDGASPDPDPRIRFDAFDCTTFVETTIALALADDLDGARRLLDVIRYKDGRVDYLARRHFPESEWIPDLVRMGVLVEATREIGGADVIVASKKLDRKLWARSKKHKGAPPLPDERIPEGVFAVDVWPLEAALKDPQRIPPGTLVDVVRADYASAPVRVSHQGIVVEKNGKRYLRHAADRMHHSVVDEPLDAFFARMAKYKKWPVAGFHLARIVVPTTLQEFVTRGG